MTPQRRAEIERECEMSFVSGRRAAALALRELLDEVKRLEDRVEHLSDVIQSGDIANALKEKE